MYIRTVVHLRGTIFFFKCSLENVYVFLTNVVHIYRLTLQFRKLLFFSNNRFWWNFLWCWIIQYIIKELNKRWYVAVCVLYFTEILTVKPNEWEHLNKSPFIMHNTTYISATYTQYKWIIYLLHFNKINCYL